MTSKTVEFDFDDMIVEETDELVKGMEAIFSRINMEIRCLPRSSPSKNIHKLGRMEIIYCW